MKLNFKKAVAALIISVCALSSVFCVSAADATSYTYTLTADNEWARTQDAYLTSAILMKAEELYKPQDMFVFGDELYIADTGNARIVKKNIKTGETAVLGEEYVGSPTGVFVNGNGEIYIADNGNCAIYVLSPAGELIKTYERPTNPSFGKDTQYVPSKVAVNSAGIIFVVSEGSYDGMVQLNPEGEFLGYYGYNNNPMSITEYLQDLFFTEEQKSRLFNRVPFSFKSLAIDKKGLIYTVTQSVEGNAVKRHDTSGRNLFPSDMADEMNFVDVAVGNYGQVYAITETGILCEYDTDGNLLFSLGGTALSYERNGLFTVASSVAADSYGNVYLLDTERGLVHVMTPTYFADSVHTAMNLFNNGHYEESKSLWKEISKISSNSRIVENGIASCEFQMHNYEAAAEHYRTADNREGYSDAYWQIRNAQVTKYLPYALVVILLAVVAFFAFGIYRKKHPAKKRNISKLEKDMRLIGRVIRHPIDTFYDIRRAGAGSYISATVIYLIGYVVFVLNFLFRGFVVSYSTTDNTSLLYVSILYLIPVGLFVGSNFFVGEIHESEARFRDVYISTAYTFSPFIVIMPFIIFMSHFMTNAEGRLLSLASFAVYAWVAIMLFLSAKEIHAYTVPKVIKNILITVFLMAVVVLAVSLFVMFWDQLADFIFSIVRELNYRVT